MGWEGQHKLTQDPPSWQRVNVQFNNGEHGFNNEVMDMKTIFRAVGPSFKKGLEVEPFESVHVYELMCKLLGIVPEANDGLLSTLLPILQETTTTPSGVPPGSCRGWGPAEPQPGCPTSQLVLPAPSCPWLLGTSGVPLCTSAASAGEPVGVSRLV